MYVHNEHWHSPLTFSLLDYRIDLAHRADRANFLERILPAQLSQLWTDINELKRAVKALKEDTWVCIQQTGTITFQLLTSPVRTLRRFT